MRRLGLIAVAVLVASSGAYILAGNAETAPKATASLRAPIVVIVMENKSFASITTTAAAPYINKTLIPAGREFTDYHSIEHPSLPNYLDMTSGGNDGCTKDSCQPESITANNVFNQLRTAGFSARSYEESMPSTCDTVAHTPNYLYWAKHNPEVYYTDTKGACQADNVGLGSSFGTLADFNLVTPNICDDMHGNTTAGCPSGTNANITRGDTWLSTHVPQLVAAGAEVIVVFDEATGTGSHVLCVEVGTGAASGKSGVRYDHFSLLAGLEGSFGVPRLQKAATATPLPI